MLESLRGLMSGVIAKILIGLLVISFAIWGVSGAFIGGAATNAVVVGDTKVGLVDYRLAYLNRSADIQRQFGQRLTRDQLRALGVESAVLSQVVSGAILDETARKMGLGISGDRLARLIGEDPAFKDATGRFSRSNLEFALRRIGMSEDAYIRNRQANAVREQLIEAVSAGVAAPQAFLDAYSKFVGQTRKFRYVTVTPDDVEAPPEPSQEQISTHYEQTRDAYVAPEYRKLVVVSLTEEAIADPSAVSQEDIAAEYEKTRSRYATAEKRRVQQLSFPDQASAEAAAERLQQGETTFEDLMKDLGRSADDVDLGLLAKDEIPEQNIAEAAFAIEAKTTSGVIDGLFGPVIVRVTEIAPGETKPLEAVEEEIRKALALEQASDRLYEAHDKLEDERAAGDTLAEAASKAGLEARTIEQVDRQGNAPDGNPVTGIPEMQNMLAEAFETDVGVEADPVSLGTSGFVWYEVEAVTPERQKPLDEVRDAVIADWKQAETGKRVTELAQTIRERVAKGETMAGVSGDLLRSGDAAAAARGEDATAGQDSTVATGRESASEQAGQRPGPPAGSRVDESEFLTRNDTTGDLPAEAVKAGFSVARDSVVVADGGRPPDKLVMKVIEIEDGGGTPVTENVDRQIGEALRNDLTGTVITDLQSREDVSINERAIENAVTF